LELLFLEAGLLKRAAEGAGRNINAQLARNRYRSRFRSVMKLPMASFHANLKPSVGLKQRNELLTFMGSSLLRSYAA